MPENSGNGKMIAAITALTAIVAVGVTSIAVICTSMLGRMCQMERLQTAA